MKRSSFAILAAVLLFPVAMLWPEDSLIAQSSFGLFPNALDAANTAQEHPGMPAFSSLGANYLFAGLANIDALGSSDEAVPFKAGWYGKGEHPWMLSVSAYAKSEVSDEYKDSVTPTYTDITGATSTTSTSIYSWLSKEILNSYNFTGAFDVGGTVTFLRSFGALNLGVLSFDAFNLGAVLKADFSRGYDDLDSDGDEDATDLATWMAQNTTSATEVYYNAAGSGVTPPQPLLDYTTTTTLTDPRRLGTAELDIPFYFKAGKIGSYVKLSATGSYRDFGSSDTVVTTVPANSASVAYSDVDASVSNLVYSIGGGLEYTLALPPIVWTDDANETLVDVGFSYGSNTAKDYSSSSVTTSGTATTAGKGDATGTASTVILSEREIPDSVLAGIGFGQSFYFSLAPNCCFAFRPRLGVSYAQGPDPDDGIDGLVDAAYVFHKVQTTISSTATTYKTVVDTSYLDSDGDGTERTLEASFALPTSLKVKPSGWPFSFVLSSKSTLTFDLVFGENKTSRTQVVTTTYDSANTLLSTTTTYPASYSQTTSWLTQEWSIVTDNSIGISFELPANVSLDIAASWTDLFEFDDISLQMVVPLP